MDYPKMLYKDGSNTDDFLVVEDPGEQAAAAKDGYYPYGEGAEKPKARAKAAKDEG